MRTAHNTLSVTESEEKNWRKLLTMHQNRLKYVLKEQKLINYSMVYGASGILKSDFIQDFCLVSVFFLNPIFTIFSYLKEREQA